MEFQPQTMDFGALNLVHKINIKQDLLTGDSQWCLSLKDKRM